MAMAEDGGGFVGALRTRLVLEAPTETSDGAGGVTRQFAATMTLWGQVVALRGRQTVLAGVPGQALSHRVTLRWRSGLDSSMRLRIGSRVLAIRSVYDPDETRRVLVCLCEEVAQ